MKEKCNIGFSRDKWRHPCCWPDLEKVTWCIRYYYNSRHYCYKNTHSPFPCEKYSRNILQYTSYFVFCKGLGVSVGRERRRTVCCRSWKLFGFFREATDQNTTRAYLFDRIRFYRAFMKLLNTFSQETVFKKESYFLRVFLCKWQTQHSWHKTCCHNISP